MLASAEQALRVVTTASKVVFFAIVILLLAFHWTLDGPRTIQSLIQLLPKPHRESIFELISAMESKIGYFIGGQGALCLVVGVLALIAYLIIGLPNALVLALVAGALEAVPMIGPTLGAIPAGLIALSISPTMLLWVVVATVIIQVLENNLLVPRIMSKAVGVNPFVSLLAIFAFSSLFGVAGALMAIPIAAIIQLLLERFVFRPADLIPEDSLGRDITSRLRYEAKDLAQDMQKQARVKKGGSASNVRQIDKVMDEVEALSTDLDALLSQVTPADTRE
jgi:predicted PurR-regulated permease PerM